MGEPAMPGINHDHTWALPPLEHRTQNGGRRKGFRKKMGWVSDRGPQSALGSARSGPHFASSTTITWALPPRFQVVTESREGWVSPPCPVSTTITRGHCHPSNTGPKMGGVAKDFEKKWDG